MEKTWKALPGKAKAVVVVFIVGILMALGAWLSISITNFFSPQPTLTNDVVVKQLEKIQDLTTIEETDYGFEDYDEGGIAFLNKKQFTMFYTYEVRAGVDLEQVKIDVDEDAKMVTITLPEPQIQSVSIDPDQLRFFDAESSIFNANEVGDTAEALKDAKAKTEAKLDKEGLLEAANEQAKTVIESLYSSIAEVNGYQVTVNTTAPDAQQSDSEE